MMRHEFGGIWTQKKLEVLGKYLDFYTTALKNTPFTLHYADAFAGTGSHDPVTIDGQELLIPGEDFLGSVQKALEVQPGFHRYHFNDLNPEHAQELEALKERHPDKSIAVTRMDANEFVPQFCRSLSKNDRAVLLLDPYSTQLNWDTLQYVARSQKVDLWLLFPISVILRMTPREGSRIRPEWAATLNRLLGTADWQNALYKPMKEPPIQDLFGEQDTAVNTERLNTKELELWVTDRLRELFCYVETPVTLKNNGSPLFLFYFAVSNPNPKAGALARRAASHITKTIS